MVVGEMFELMRKRKMYKKYEHIGWDVSEKLEEIDEKFEVYHEKFKKLSAGLEVLEL